VANGNLSIILIDPGPPPEAYPYVVELCPATLYLPCVKSPTSVALALVEKGNLSIILVAPVVVPPEVYPDTSLD
jgi:hypothetical protein